MVDTVGGYNAVNLLGTPEGYATPDQLTSMNAYSKALLENSMKPIQHWTQGLQHVVEALVGGNQSYLANQKKNEADATRAGRMLPSMGGAPPFQGSLPSAGNKTTGEGTKSASQDDVLKRASNATASIESSNDYSKLGPVIPKTGDRAYGKYQVMGANLPEWTAKYVGRSMTPEEFLNNPEAQEAVYKGKFGEYVQKYGPEGAARAWFAGESGMNDPTRKDILGTTVADYSKRFSNAFGPGANQPPAVQAMAQALHPEMAAAKIPPVNTTPRPDTQGQIYINPSLIPRRPQLNEGQMRGVLADPTISEQAKLMLRQEYINSRAPIDVPYPGGVVRVDPNNPTVQQFIPEAKWGKSKLGDMETDTMLIPDGKGGLTRARIGNGPPAIGPRTEGAPAVAPAAAPQGGSEGAPIPPRPTVQSASVAPAASPEAPAQAPAGGPPAAAVTPAAAEGAVEQAREAETPLGKWAQARPPGVEMGNPAQAKGGGSMNLNNFPPEDVADYERKKAFDVKTAVDEEAQKKSVEFAMKKYDNMSTQAQSARKLKPNLDLALSLLDDPNFSSGLVHGVKDTWQRFKEATGIEKMSNAPNEVFDKLMAGTVLDTMKSVLAGLGQVRLAEIDLLNRANGNRNNGVASNRAVLEISRRAVEKIDQLDSMAQSYMSGDEVLDPVTGKTLLKANVNANGEIEPRRGLDAGFDKLARKFTNDHPSFSPDEIKNYHSLFEGKLDPNTGLPREQKAEVKKGETAPADKTLPFPPEAVEMLRSDPSKRAFFDQTFGAGSADKVLGSGAAPPVSR